MTPVEIELVNGRDCISAECGLLAENAVRRLRLRVLVDPAQIMTALPEELIAALGLQDDIADWRHSGYPVVNGVLVEAGGRSSPTSCLVLPTGERAVVGQTVMRAMDLVVDEDAHALVPHPESHGGPRMRW